MFRALLLAALLLVGCGEQVQPQPEAGDIHVIPSFTWHIVDEAELRRVYAEAGMPLTEGQKLHGFVGTMPDGSIAVATLPPKIVDDQPTCTLGHEVMHLALGGYHK